MVKRRGIIEIIVIFVFLWLKSYLVNHATLPWNDNLIVMVSYTLDILIVLFFVIKIDREPVSGIGIRPISPVDIFGGMGLGLVLYLVQVLPPIIFMHMDISQFAEPPKWIPLLIKFIFLLFTVGLGEELVFRGFLLHKMEKIVSHKMVAVLFNGLLFYMIHLTQAFVFDWTQVYSTFATTIILSIYFFRSKKRSLLPLIIAHAMLDALLGAPGFYLLNLIWQ